MPTRTAEAARAESAKAFNAFMDVCPSRQLLESISNKWVTLILTALGAGSMRYSDLARRIAGVSQKMLTQTLRQLERDGLITRTVTPAVPVRVDYELTDLGTDLMSVISVLKAWAETHMAEVAAARTDYDAAIASD